LLEYKGIEGGKGKGVLTQRREEIVFLSRKGMGQNDSRIGERGDLQWKMKVY